MAYHTPNDGRYTALFSREIHHNSRAMLFAQWNCRAKGTVIRMMEFDQTQNSPEFWDGQGCAHCAAERYEAAIAAFNQALELDINYCKAWNNKGNALCGLKRYGEALAAYERAIALQPDYHQAWFNRGQLFVDLQAYGNAVESFERAIAIHPDPRYIHARSGIWLNKKLITV